MAVKGFQKINDLSQSPLRDRFFNTSDYIPDSNEAVAFGRVSIIRNKNAGNSDLAQKERNDDYISAKGLKIVKEWDVAETAFVHEDRKFFTEVDTYLRTHPSVKHVIFSHVSRACRNKISAMMLEDWALNLKVIIHFARENLMLHYRSDQSVWIIWRVKVAQHEQESENTRKNVMDGMIKRIEMGLFPSRAPYGYKNIRREGLGLSVFMFNGDKSNYMKFAFQKFSQGTYSIPALKRELDREFSHLDRTPNTKQLETLLKNPFYYGDFIWNDALYRGNPEYHPQLISYALWTKVQNIFKNPGRSKKKLTQRNHPYLGMLKCSGVLLDDSGAVSTHVCNAAITCEEKRRKYKNGTEQVFYYYHCSRSTGRCSQKDATWMAKQGRRVSYNENQLEDLFLEIVRPLKFDEEICKWMQEMLMEEHRGNSEDHRQQVSALRRREQMLHQYIDRAYEDKLNGSIAEEMWREKNTSWRNQLSEVEKQISALGEMKDEYIQNGVLLIELMQRAVTTFENANSEKKRKIIEIISSNLRLSNGSSRFVVGSSE